MVGYLGEKRKLYVGATKIKKGFVGATKVYSAGNIVTYHVDTGEQYTEEVDSDASCLSPKTFTPSRPGWVFDGWREDSTASSSDLSNKVMGDDPVELYAVFYQVVTLTYNGNGSTSGSTTSQSNKRYYNNGNITNPTFKLSDNGFKNGNFTFTGWAIGSVSGTRYNAGSDITLSANTTFYAKWEFYVMQNGQWNIPKPEGWLYYWQCEFSADNEGGFGVYDKGVDNNTNGNSSWSSQSFSANGMSNIRIVVSTMADEGTVNSEVFVRGTNWETEGIKAVGTYTGTITDDSVQIVLWSEKGDYVYLDEIYIY